jgi:hypothetical protein
MDVAEAQHLGEARKTRDTVGAHAIAIGLGDEASGECGARGREAKREQDALNAVVELVESDPNHDSLERKRRFSGNSVIGEHGGNR